jgi:hypothetical protein
MAGKTTISGALGSTGISPGVAPEVRAALDVLAELSDDPLGDPTDRVALTRFVLERCRIEAIAAGDPKVRLEAAREIARVLGIGQYAPAAPASGGRAQQNNFFLGPRPPTAALPDAKRRTVALAARLDGRSTDVLAPTSTPAPIEEALVTYGPLADDPTDLTDPIPALDEDEVFNPEDGRDDPLSAAEDAEIAETVAALSEALEGDE